MSKSHYQAAALAIVLTLSAVSAAFAGGRVVVISPAWPGPVYQERIYVQRYYTPRIYVRDGYQQRRYDAYKWRDHLRWAPGPRRVGPYGWRWNADRGPWHDRRALDPRRVGPYGWRD